MSRLLEVHEVGDPYGSPVLYLHGSGSSRLEADVYQPAAVETGVRLIAWDRPGSGLSPAYPHRAICDVLADAAQVLDQLGIDRAPAVGLSGGGTHVLALASGSDRITRAVAVNPGGPATQELLRELPARMRLLVRSARKHPALFRQLAKPMERMGSSLEKTLASKVRTRSMDPVDLEVLRDPGVLHPFARAAAEGSRQAGAWRTEAELFWGRDWDFDPMTRVAPLDVFSGSTDPYRAFALALERHGATLHTFRGGHVSGFTSPVMREVLTTALSSH